MLPVIHKHLGGNSPQYALHPVGLKGFEPAMPWSPVKSEMFVSVRGCSEITLVQGFEQQRTQADISGECYGTEFRVTLDL